MSRPCLPGPGLPLSDPSGPSVAGGSLWPHACSCRDERGGVQPERFLFESGPHHRYITEQKFDLQWVLRVILEMRQEPRCNGAVDRAVIAGESSGRPGAVPDPLPSSRSGLGRRPREDGDLGTFRMASNCATPNMPEVGDGEGANGDVRQAEPAVRSRSTRLRRRSVTSARVAAGVGDHADDEPLRARHGDADVDGIEAAHRCIAFEPRLDLREDQRVPSRTPG
jgi:hypothetical protein